MPCGLLAFLGMEATAFSDREISNEGLFFSEAIVQAKEMLWIGYQGYSFEERAHCTPAACVTAFLQSLDAGYTICDKQPSKELVERSAIEAFFTKEDTALSKESSFVVPFSKPIEKEHVIQIALLNQVARSPLKAYFQDTFGIYLYQKSESREFSFTYPSRRTIVPLAKEAFCIPNEELGAFADKKIVLAQPLLQKMAKQHFQERVVSFKQAADSLGIDLGLCMQVTLSSMCKKVEQRGERSWCVPAIELFVQGMRICIEGTMDTVHPNGMLSFEAKSSLFRIWPELVIRAMLAEQMNLLPLNTVYFLKDGKKIAIAMPAPEKLLASYAVYALECASLPSFLYPDWITFVLENECLEEASFMKKYASQSFGYQDPYQALFVEKMPFQAISQQFDRWHAQAKVLFSPCSDTLGGT